MKLYAILYIYACTFGQRVNTFHEGLKYMKAQNKFENCPVTLLTSRGKI